MKSNSPTGYDIPRHFSLKKSTDAASFCSFFFIKVLYIEFELWWQWYVQSNLMIRNFLVTLKLFLIAKCSLSQTFNQSTILGIYSILNPKNPAQDPPKMHFFSWKWYLMNQEKKVSFSKGSRNYLFLDISKVSLFVDIWQVQVHLEQWKY